MAVIEVCDICRKEVSKSDGITLDCSDWDGWDYPAGVHIRAERNYKVRICGKCKDNIIEYCKKRMLDKINRQNDPIYMPVICRFRNDYFEINNSIIDKDRIMIFEVENDFIKRKIPFDIQIKGPKGFETTTIIPKSDKNDFLIKYYQLYK